MVGAPVQVLLVDPGEGGAFLIPIDVTVHADSSCPKLIFETNCFCCSCNNRCKNLIGYSGTNAVAAD